MNNMWPANSRLELVPLSTNPYRVFDIENPAADADAAGALGLGNLPADLLIKIAHELSYRDLMRFVLVNRHVHNELAELLAINRVINQVMHKVVAVICMKVVPKAITVPARYAHPEVVFLKLLWGSLQFALQTQRLISTSVVPNRKKLFSIIPTLPLGIHSLPDASKSSVRDVLQNCVDGTMPTINQGLSIEEEIDQLADTLMSQLTSEAYSNTSAQRIFTVLAGLTAELINLFMSNETWLGPITLALVLMTLLSVAYQQAAHVTTELEVRTSTAVSGLFSAVKPGTAEFVMLEAIADLTSGESSPPTQAPTI